MYSTRRRLRNAILQTRVACLAYPLCDEASQTGARRRESGLGTPAGRRTPRVVSQAGSRLRCGRGRPAGGTLTVTVTLHLPSLPAPRGRCRKKLIESLQDDPRKLIGLLSRSSLRRRLPSRAARRLRIALPVILRCRRRMGMASGAHCWRTPRRSKYNSRAPYEPTTTAPRRRATTSSKRCPVSSAMTTGPRCRPTCSSRARCAVRELAVHRSAYTS